MFLLVAHSVRLCVPVFEVHIGFANNCSNKTISEDQIVQIRNIQSNNYLLISPYQRLIRTLCIIFLIAFALILSEPMTLHADEGKMVFTIRNPQLNEDGFRITTRTLDRAQDTSKWWEFYQYNICTMNPDGTDFKQLTDDDVSRKPRLSPDGEFIAYISGVDREKSLYIMLEDGTEKTQLLKKMYNIHDFWWSPTSQSILVVVEIDRPKDRLENWEVDFDGETSKWRTRYWAKGWLHWDAKGEKVKEPNRRLLEVLPEGIQWPEWSPDRRWIAFITDGVLALAEPQIVSMGRTWFLQQDEPPCDGIEEWSPDGKQVLFYTSGEICVATVEQGKFESYQNLSLYQGHSATWSPDGSKIAFIGADSNRRRTSEIFTIDVETGNMEQITSSTHDFFDLHWR